MGFYLLGQVPTNWDDTMLLAGQLHPPSWYCRPLSAHSSCLFL